jgi:hypothetical protein
MANDEIVPLYWIDSCLCIEFPIEDRDIIAVGFDPKKIFIFSDLDYMGVTWEAFIQMFAE